MVDEDFKVPVLLTYDDIVHHWNEWAEREKKLLRVRETFDGRVFEWFDPLTGEVAL